MQKYPDMELEVEHEYIEPARSQVECQGQERSAMVFILVELSTKNVSRNTEKK